MLARTPIDIGLAIRERRRALGLDQRTLAAKVGVNRQWVIDLEKGKPGAGFGLVLRALSVLGLRLRLDPEEASTPKAAGATAPAIDIDAIIERALGKKP